VFEGILGRWPIEAVGRPRTGRARKAAIVGNRAGFRLEFFHQRSWSASLLCKPALRALRHHDVELHRLDFGESYLVHWRDGVGGPRSCLFITVSIYAGAMSTLIAYLVVDRRLHPKAVKDGMHH